MFGYCTQRAWEYLIPPKPLGCHVFSILIHRLSRMATPTEVGKYTSGLGSHRFNSTPASVNDRPSEDRVGHLELDAETVFGLSKLLRATASERGEPRRELYDQSEKRHSNDIIPHVIDQTSISKRFPSYPAEAGQVGPSTRRESRQSCLERLPRLTRITMQSKGLVRFGDGFSLGRDDEPHPAHILAIGVAGASVAREVV